VSCQAAIIFLSARASLWSAKALRRPGKRENAASAMFLKPGWHGHRFDHWPGAAFCMPGRPWEDRFERLGWPEGIIWSARAAPRVPRWRRRAPRQPSRAEMCEPAVCTMFSRKDVLNNTTERTTVVFTKFSGGPGGIGLSAWWLGATILRAGRPGGIASSVPTVSREKR